MGLTLGERLRQATDGAPPSPLRLEQRRWPVLPAVPAMARAPPALPRVSAPVSPCRRAAARRRAAESSRRAAWRRVFKASNAAPPLSDCGASASAAASALFASSSATRAVSSFASTPERWATSSSSTPTVRTDRMSVFGSASPGLPSLRRISATALRLPSSSPWRTGISLAVSYRLRNSPQPSTRLASCSAAASSPIARELGLEEPVDRDLCGLLLYGQLYRLGLQPRDFVAPAFRRRRQVGERQELRFRLAQRREMRQRGEQPPDGVGARAPLRQAPARGVVGRLRLVALADELGVGRGERIGLVALVLQRLERPLPFGQFRLPTRAAGRTFPPSPAMRRAGG